MLIRKIEDAEEILANDNSVVREIMHPHHTNFGILYSITHATVKKGEKSLPHYLDHSEVYYILEGEGVMHARKQTDPAEKEDIVKVTKDHAVFLAPKEIQYVENSGEVDLKFLCLVYPYWRSEIDHKL